MKKRRMFAFVAIILIVLIMLVIETSVVANAIYNIDFFGSTGLPMPQFIPYGGDASISTFITKYKNVATFIGGIATITMVGAMLYNVGRLNLSVSNPMQRQQCIRGIVVCGIMAALLGSATLFIGLFYGLFL